MRLDRIQLFVSIAKCLSITQASREHHVSQPAVSRQLKLLQQDLGITLIKKNGRGVELTAAGQAFFDEVATLASRVDSFKNNYGRQSSQNLTIGGGHGPSSYFLPSILTHFGLKHPSAKLSLRTGSATEVEGWLIRAEVDLALVSSPIDAPTLKKELYRSEPLIAFVARHHPLAQRKTLRSSAGGEIALVIRIRRDGPSRTEAELNLLAKKGITYKIALRCESPESVKEAVRQGAGVGILYRDMIVREINRGEFLEVNIPGIELAGRQYIVYPDHKPLSRLAQEFLSLLRASS